jgi:hypothetical protein
MAGANAAPTSAHSGLDNIGVAGIHHREKGRENKGSQESREPNSLALLLNTMNAKRAL